MTGELITGVSPNDTEQNTQENVFNITIANRLQERRKVLRLKQEEIASAIGITKNHLSALERGVNKMNLNIFVDYCNAVSINPLDVLGEFAQVRDSSSTPASFRPSVHMYADPVSALPSGQPATTSETSPESERLNLLKQVMSLPADERKMALKMYSGD